MTACDRDVRGDPRALGADRVLGHLDHDLLPCLEQCLDLWRLAAVAPASAPPRLLSLAAAVLVQVVADVEKGRLFQADLHEGGLHTRENAADTTEHHRSGDAPIAFPLDVEFGELPLLEDRHPDFPGAGVHQKFVVCSGFPAAGIRHGTRLQCWRAVSGTRSS